MCEIKLASFGIRAHNPCRGAQELRYWQSRLVNLVNLLDLRNPRTTLQTGWLGPARTRRKGDLRRGHDFRKCQVLVCYATFDHQSFKRCALAGLKFVHTGFEWAHTADSVTEKVCLSLRGSDLGLRVVQGFGFGVWGVGCRV